MGYQILAITPDSVAQLGESKGKIEMSYQLLSDSKMEASQAFGLAYQVDDKTLERYKGYGIDLEAASGEKHHLLPVPAVFFVGTDGVIDFSYVNPDYRVRIEPEILLAAAKVYKSGK